MNWISIITTITAILVILFNIGLIFLAVYYWPKFNRFIIFPEAEDNSKIGRAHQVFHKILYKLSTTQLKIFSYALIVLVAMNILNAPFYLIYLILKHFISN